MATVKILESYCKGCGLCVWVCQADGLEMADELNAAGVFVARVIPGSECTGCARCATMCPEGAIEITIDDSSPTAPDASSAQQAGSATTTDH